MTQLGQLGHRLYAGETSYDFMGNRKFWYGIATLVIVISFASMLIRGFNLGIEFRGGASFQFPQGTHSVADARAAVESVGVSAPIVQQIGSEIRVQTEPLTEGQVSEVSAALSREFGVPQSALNPSTVGAAWGDQITKKALRGLLVFLVLVVIYISIRFEWRMAAAAIIALLHDLIVTAGVYSISGFEVTPATVIAWLTILGYSLYDTVVVFDKVQENTRGLAGGSRSTYAEAANLAVNQTLARSINTTVIALLPVAGLLFIGAGVLHASTLKDLALALFVGLAAGAYSSIFIATPLLADLKEREPQYRALTARVAARRRADTGRPVRSAAGVGPRRAATAVLDRAGAGREAPVDAALADDAIADDATADDATADEATADRARVDDAAASGPAGAGVGARPARPGGPARSRPPRKGGRPGRPSGKRRR